MQALTAVTALLVLLSIATYTRVQRAVGDDLLISSLQGQLQARRAISIDWERGIYQLQIQAQREQESGTHGRGEGKGTRHRIRRVESRLNLAVALLSTKPHDRQFFQDLAQRLVPDPTLPQIFAILERKLSPIYVARAEEFCHQPTSFEQLACFDLEDPDLQACWPRLLERLSETVSWEPENAKINITFAPLPLLEAIFGQTPAVTEFFHWREALLDDYNASVRDPDGPQRRDVRNAIIGRTRALGSPDLQRYFSYRLSYKPSGLTLRGEDERGRIHLHKLRQT